MNSLGWTILVKMGCLCTKQSVEINGSKYIVRERVAEGGFSLIDLVESAQTKRKFALKRITCHSIEDQRLAIKEVEITRSLNHPNIVPIIDYECEGNADIVVNLISHVYILMPYFKNGSLSEHLAMRAAKQDFMREEEILRLFLGICEALKAMHEFKPDALAHRDLKTANVCLSNSMEPILVDLGSASAARQQICGQQDSSKLQEWAEERCTAVYRAPELFVVQNYCLIDERTDIWSLGCVLYAMCFFKCPFDAAYEKGDSVALAVLSGNITFPESSPFSEDMLNLITFMLRINPMERPYIYSVIEEAQKMVSKMEDKL